MNSKMKQKGNGKKLRSLKFKIVMFRRFEFIYTFFVTLLDSIKENFKRSDNLFTNYLPIRMLCLGTVITTMYNNLIKSMLQIINNYLKTVFS